MRMEQLSTCLAPPHDSCAEMAVEKLRGLGLCLDAEPAVATSEPFGDLFVRGDVLACGTGAAEVTGREVPCREFVGGCGDHFLFEAVGPR